MALHLSIKYYNVHTNGKKCCFFCNVCDLHNIFAMAVELIMKISYHGRGESVSGFGSRVADLEGQLTLEWLGGLFVEEREEKLEAG